MTERRETKGAAVVAALSAGINDTDMTITVTPITGWPTGSIGPFVIAIDRGLSTEEKIKIASRSGNTLTVATGGRGFDNTVAKAHTINATTEHVLSANDIDQLNKHAADTTIDEHTQYVHLSNVRTVTAAHNFTEAVVFSGNPVFSGTPQFTNGLDLTTLWAAAGDLATLGSGAAAAGSGSKVAHANHRHPLNMAEIAAAIFPVGMYAVIAHSAALPAGWVDADGQAVSRAANPVAWAAWGTQYGPGDGVTTFNVPNAAKKFLSGHGSGRAIGSTGGTDDTTLTEANLAPHSHACEAAGTHSHANDPHKHPVDGDGGFRYVATVTGPQNQSLGGPTQSGGVAFTDTDPVSITIQSAGSHAHAIGSTGSASPFTNLPSYITGRIIIKVH